MKNTMKLFVVFVFTAIIGFSFIACDDVGGNDPLNGTWVNSVYGVQLVLNNGNFTVSMSSVEMYKGTYSTSASNMTMAITQFSGPMLNMMYDEFTFSEPWYTRAQFKTALLQEIIALFGIPGMTEALAEAAFNELLAMEEPGMTLELMLDGMFYSETGPYTLNDNTLTVTMEGESISFTR